MFWPDLQDIILYPSLISSPVTSSPDDLQKKVCSSVYTGLNSDTSLCVITGASCTFAFTLSAPFAWLASHARIHSKRWLAVTCQPVHQRERLYSQPSHVYLCFKLSICVLMWSYISVLQWYVYAYYFHRRLRLVQRYFTSFTCVPLSCSCKCISCFNAYCASSDLRRCAEPKPRDVDRPIYDKMYALGASGLVKALLQNYQEGTRYTQSSLYCLYVKNL